jgi:L-rhamnose mutarotase
MLALLFQELEEEENVREITNTTHVMVAQTYKILSSLATIQRLAGGIVEESESERERRQQTGNRTGAVFDYVEYANSIAHLLKVTASGIQYIANEDIQETMIAKILSLGKKCASFSYAIFLIGSTHSLFNINEFEQTTLVYLMDAQEKRAKAREIADIIELVKSLFFTSEMAFKDTLSQLLNSLLGALKEMAVV